MSISLRLNEVDTNIIKSYASNVKEGYQAPIFNISTDDVENNTSRQIEFNLSN